MEVPFARCHVNRYSGTKRQKVQSVCTFSYVPLLQTLQQLLSNKDIQNELEMSQTVDSPHYHDYCSGSVWREHQLFRGKPHALQIIAYYDELEVVNPIGSYVNTHKLGCLFFTLGNIRPMYRSTLKAIWLLAVAKLQNINKYGIDSFLEPFVDDLKTLFLDGVVLQNGSDSRTYFGALLAFLADTAAAHKVGGFKESVSFANRICRSCMATKSSSQSCFSEDQFTLRTPEDHEDQCLALCNDSHPGASVEFGVNRASILQNVPGFSVASGMPHDVMHDLFEGVVHYELKLLMQHCVSEKFLGVELLNRRIQGFDFGSDEKPSPIDPRSLDSLDKKFRQSAAQTISLTRNLPLLIADKIPEDDPNWVSFLLLIRICQIALSPVLSRDTVPYLRILVEEKLTALTKLYPGSSIKPKMHYMLHYGSQIERYGPLIHSWTMRHEAKLSFVKRSSRRGNFKNIVKTVVTHHQYWLAYHLKCTDNLLYPIPELNTKPRVDNFSAQSEHMQAEIMRVLDCATSDDLTLYHHKWIKLQSTCYKVDDYILLEHDGFLPTFGKVKDVIFIKETYNYLFHVIHYASVFFSTHFNAFSVVPTSTESIVNVRLLKDHHRLLAHNSFCVSDKHLYIVLPTFY